MQTIVRNTQADNADFVWRDPDVLGHNIDQTYALINRWPLDSYWHG